TGAGQCIASSEICDGQDNDCDGQTDEDQVCGADPDADAAGSSRANLPALIGRN
ncbi:MAG: hypothetical protein D6800_13715, partial [Candidatus Zixiibacteriota bacterium]